MERSERSSALHVPHYDGSLAPAPELFPEPLRLPLIGKSWTGRTEEMEMGRIALPTIVVIILVVLAVLYVF